MGQNFLGGGLTLSATATINLGSNTLTFLNQGTGNLVTNGVISGTGAVVVSGAGQYVPGGANTYSATLSAGTSTIPQVNSTGNPGAVTSGPLGTGTITAFPTAALRAPVGAALILNNNVTLQGGITFLNAATEKNITLGGPVTLAGGNAVITSTVGNSVPGTLAIISGAIGDGGNNFSLTKAGTGNLVLGGANTYTGGTIVNAGVLFLSGSLASTGNVTVAGGSHLSLATGAANPLNTSGILNFATGTQLGLDLGTTSDRIASAVPATVAGKITFNINPIGGFGANAYTLLSAASGLTAGGATYSLGSLPGGFTYTLTPTDNAATLTVVNGGPAASTFYWGAGNGTWTNAANWFSDSDGTTPAGRFLVRGRR